MCSMASQAPMAWPEQSPSSASIYQPPLFHLLLQVPVGQLTRGLVCSGHILSLQPPLHCLECPHFLPHSVVLTAFTGHSPKTGALPPLWEP